MAEIRVPTNGDSRSEDSAALHAISITQFLNHDRRPAIVLDLQKASSPLDLSASAAFINPALRDRSSLLGLLHGHSSDDAQSNKQDYQNFLTWSQSLDTKTSANHFRFAGFEWTCTTLDARWRVIFADLIHDPCTCTVRVPEPTPKPSSTLISDAVSSMKHSETESNDRYSSRPSRHDSRSTSTTNKNLNPLARARNFFAGDAIKEDNDKDIGPNARVQTPEREPELDAKARESDAFGIWSDIRVAKRNADLLTKISAFETIGISITDNDGTIVFANDAWYNITGIPHGPADASAWMGIFESDEIPKIADVWKRITVEQEPGYFQTPLKWRWDSPAPTDAGVSDFPVWISVWAYPDVSIHGETIGCCTVLTDVSQQKWTERLIEQQLANAVERAKVLEQLSNDLALTESRFRRISDSMPHGIFVCNTSGNMLYTNDAYRAIFPNSRDPTSQEPWWSYIPEHEVARATEIWTKLKEDRAKISFEMSFFVPSGSTSVPELRYTACSSYPELDDKGEIKHITGTVTDITHLKLAEQTQGARADNAEESKRQLERFIDMTSHEIRNPLSAIVHSAEEILSALQHYPRSVTAATIKGAMETLETIIDCTNHSTRIVDDILVVSKLESGLLNIAPSTVRLVTAVKQCLKMFDGEMRAAEISSSLTIDKSFNDNEIDWVCIDANRVLQILVNFITNAIKFTRLETFRQINTHLSASLDRPTSNANLDEPQFLPAQTEPSVTYPEVAKTEGEVIYIKISVTDTGCGISQDEQKNLFQRFSQAGKRTHVKYGGTGLGLFISRQLCEMQGGQIGLQSTTGKGSTFTFYVKAMRSTAPEIKNLESGIVDLHLGIQQARASLSRSNSGPAVIGAGTDADPSIKRTILLVEDNLVNQKVVAKMLRGRGFGVLVANHGLEALDHIRDSALFSGAPTSATPISLILLDVEMPVMDGLTCIRHIRQMEETGELQGHVPVVAVTANARQEQMDQAKDAGMDDVVTKPFRIDRLLSVMTPLWDQYPV